MSTAAPLLNTATVSADEFQALEQKVLRTVELIKSEREARAAAEAQLATAESTHAAAQAEIARLREQLSTQNTQAGVVEDELAMLRREREAVRERVEKLVRQLDELA